MSIPADNDAFLSHSLGALLHLARRARQAGTTAELGFIAVNETLALAPYRQAALWVADRGVVALSGVVAPEANAPFVHWLERVLQKLLADQPKAADVTPADLAPDEAAEWDEWLPAHALWLPLPHDTPGGLLLARDTPWQPAETSLLTEWMDIWGHEWKVQAKPGAATGWRRLASVWPDAGQRLAARRSWFSAEGWQARLQRGRVWRPADLGGQLAGLWQRRGLRYSILALAVMLFPVRFSVLAPGELVPAQPAVVRAPLDGTVDTFFVAPNTKVKAGDKLFQLDLTTLSSRLAVARQGLVTAEAEYRQSAQQAVFDPKSKAQLAALQGRIAERQAEADLLQAQFAKAQATAPRDGIVLMDDPSEWIGRPVTTGERIVTIAGEDDAEVEAWLGPGDIIDLPSGAEVTLYLNTAPLSPVEASLRYLAHEAVARPDGSFAYRLRATLAEGQERPRVGLKGTVKVRGGRVPLIYWALRRPLATLRQVTGL